MNTSDTKAIDPLHVTGWTIHAEGDRTVGIFSQTWQLDGDMFFENIEDKEEFRSSIVSAFELVCGEPVHMLSHEEAHSIDQAMELPDMQNGQ